MDPWIPFAAPVLGAVIGLVAGLYPAVRAGRIEPIDALRSAG
jgi:putative ABC transport system permease protein